MTGQSLQIWAFSWRLKHEDQRSSQGVCIAARPCEQIKRFAAMTEGRRACICMVSAGNHLHTAVAGFAAAIILARTGLAGA